MSILNPFFDQEFFRPDKINDSIQQGSLRKKSPHAMKPDCINPRLDPKTSGVHKIATNSKSQTNIILNPKITEYIQQPLLSSSDVWTCFACNHINKQLSVRCSKCRKLPSMQNMGNTKDLSNHHSTIKNSNRSKSSANTQEDLKLEIKYKKEQQVNPRDRDNKYSIDTSKVLENSSAGKLNRERIHSQYSQKEPEHLMGKQSSNIYTTRDISSNLSRASTPISTNILAHSHPCKETCLIKSCGRTLEYHINYSRYHGICEIHFKSPEILTGAYLCTHCGSSIKIIRSQEFSIKINGQKKSANKINFNSFLKKGPPKSLSPSNNKFPVLNNSELQ